MGGRTEPRSDFYIYALCRENGVPFYIGKGRGNRWEHHEKSARSGTNDYKCAIIRGMHARGLEVIKTKVCEGLTDATAHAYEVALIKAIGRYPDGPLANLTDGGDGTAGFKHTLEECAKRSAKQKGKKLSPEHIANLSAVRRISKATLNQIAKLADANRGRKMTQEQCKNVSRALLGRIVSPDTRAKISAAQRGKPRPHDGISKMAASKRGKPQSAEHIALRAAANMGGTRSLETRAKMSAAMLGKTKSSAHREKLAEATRAYYARIRSATAAAT